MLKRLFSGNLLQLLILSSATLANPFSQSVQSDASTQSRDPFTMRVDVDLTTMDVVARDKNGNPIPNLKIEDFQIYEDGKKQKILSFDEVKEDSSQNKPDPQSIIEDDQHRGKTVLILFLGGALRPDTLQNMQDSAAKFVREHMGPHDRFALASGTSFRILQNFTMDRDEMLAAIQGYSFKFGSGVTYEGMLQILERLGAALSHIKGQKSILIYVTAASHYVPGNPSIRAAMAKAILSAKKANVVFYTVDPSVVQLSGVDSAAPNAALNRSASPYPATSTLGISSSLGPMMSLFSDLAAGTGGYAIQTMGDINSEIDKLGRQLGNYYILGFQSSNSKHDGAFRKIEIKTGVKGVQLRHRPGYQDRGSIDVLASSKQERRLLGALAAPESAGQLPIVFRSMYFYDTPKAARVIVAARIRMEKVALKRDAGQLVANLNIMGAAYADDGTVSARFSEAIPISIQTDEESQFRLRSLSYRNYLILRPGKYRLKLAVSDESNNLGAMEHSLEVPSLPEQGVAAGSLVIAEQTSRLPELIQNIQAQMLDDTDPLIYSGAQVEPSAENRISVNSAIPVLFRLYGLGGEPREWNLTARAKLLDDKEHPVFLDPVSLKDSITSLGNGTAALAFALPFKNVSPGTYQLIIDIVQDGSEIRASLQSDIQFYK